MQPPSDNHIGGIETLLDICDKLDRLHRAIADTDSLDPVTALEEKDAITHLLREFLNDPSDDIDSMLSTPALSMKLEKEDIDLLAVLFHQRLITDEGFMTGRDLLWVLQETPADLLSESKRLSSSSRLMKQGLITRAVADEVSEQDLLSQPFRLANEPFYRLCAGESIIRTPVNDAASESVSTYSNPEEHLHELEALSRLAQQRSVVFFDEGLWHETVFRPGCSPAETRRRVREKQGIIAEKLTNTPDAVGFPLNRLANEYSLSTDETLILSTLLFQECLRGVGSVAVIDLLRLVSSSPAELAANRTFFAPSSPLIASGLVHVQTDVEGKVSTGAAEIANWAVARILTPRAPKSPPIHGDDRIAFHEFLNRINCSSEFFERLG